MLNANVKSVSPSTILSFSSLIKDIQILEVLLAICVFLIIHSVTQWRRYGMSVWPVVGMLPSLIFGLRSNGYEWITNVLIHTDMTFRFTGPTFSNLNCVVTSDPLNVKHMLNSRFPNFPKGDYFRATLADLLGNGIFNSDHDTWQRQRKTASLVFHSASFRQLTDESLFDLVHQRLVPVLVDVIDLQDVLLRLTFDNVCMIALGVDPGCLRSDLPEIPFAHAFERATELSALRFVIPTCIWNTMRRLNIGPEKELKESIHVVNEFAEKVIRTRKEELNNINNNTQRSDLLSVFMMMKQDNGKPFSEIFIRDICVNFILAGRDTSSVALCWFFWLIDRHKQVEERILDEICGIIRERESEGISDIVVFKAEEIKKMEYLHAAISEALTLYPSVPVDHKEVVEDDVFPDGAKLKKGTKVIYAIYSMGRMEAIWGKDCREYKPERWLRDGKFITESAYKFTAFNGGTRLCLGRDFAYYQMKFVAASIMYKYHVNVVENHLVEPKLALTMYMKHGLKVHIIKRHESRLQN